MRRILALSALALLSLASLPARAEDVTCPEVAQDQWLSEEAGTAKAVEQGYVVRSMEAQDGCWEAYATDSTGKKVELYLHPATGEILSVQDAD